MLATEIQIMHLVGGEKKGIRGEATKQKEKNSFIKAEQKIRSLNSTNIFIFCVYLA